MAAYTLSGSANDRSVTISQLTDAETVELWSLLRSSERVAHHRPTYRLINMLARELPIADGDNNPILPECGLQD